MKVAGYEILGTSRSGIATCLVLPDLKLVFDMGTCHEEALKFQNVFITHGHPDHISGLVRHAAVRDMVGKTQSRFFVPEHLVGLVQDMFGTAEKMQQDTIAREVIGCQPGDQIPLGNGRHIRVFETDHSLPAQGYAVVQTKQKLKPELTGRSGVEIGRLRQSGVEVTDTVETIEVVYPGDTRCSVLDTVPALMEARLLIMEATFLGDKQDRDFAASRGHTHLNDHFDRAERYQNEAVLFVHWSARYTPQQVLEAVSERPATMRPDCQAFI